MADTFSAFPFGWEVDSGALVHPEGRRQDWGLTSSGVGLNYRPPLPFPPPNARSTIQEPLPPASQKVWRDEVIPQMATTTQLAHCVKNHSELLVQPRYSVSASHPEVHYNKDLREKLKLRKWRFPLTMGNQKSEIQANFRGWPNLPYDPTFHAGPQPFKLAAHHEDGASKSVVATTQNRDLAGRPFYICDKAVLRLNEPYLPTSMDFRIFTQKEHQGYTWKDNLKLGRYPLIRVPGPMRDFQLFPKPTRVPHLILNPTVPHRGLLSLTKESYQLPNDHKHTWDRYCPVQQPPTVSCRVPVVEIMCVPHMYETEYKCYGSGKPMPV
ncbi:stabilizer of axonemal microtubules 3 [Erythrolamprus reginae]|uniref:stabilizer of axonemal microtubules 3 n=1 Tax=Erythrolamprus reginae TaxID=121349 RepID=UPI00396CD332